MDSASSATAPTAAVSLSASSCSIRTTGTRTSSHGRGKSSAAQPTGGSLPYTQSCPKLLPHLPSSATITPRAPARCAVSTLMRIVCVFVSFSFRFFQFVAMDVCLFFRLLSWIATGRPRGALVQSMHAHDFLSKEKMTM